MFNCFLSDQFTIEAINLTITRFYHEAWDKDSFNRNTSLILTIINIFIMATYWEELCNVHHSPDKNMIMQETENSISVQCKTVHMTSLLR